MGAHHAVEYRVEEDAEEEWAETVADGVVSAERCPKGGESRTHMEAAVVLMSKES